MFYRFLGLIVVCLMLGCGGEDSSENAVLVTDNDFGVPGELGLEMDSQTRVTEDVDAPDVGMDVIDAAHDDDMALPIEQPEPTNTIERVTPSRWLRAFLPPNADPLAELYDRGDVFWPMEEDGTDNLGVLWQPMAQDEDGTLGSFGVARGYALAEIPLEPGERLMMRLDRGVQAWTTGSVQPADFYGSGKSLSPLLHRGDTAVVAIFVDPRRGAPRVQFFKTTDEFAFNLNDMTVPHLVVGSMESLPVGVPILNLLTRTIANLEMHVLENEYFEASTVTHPGIVAGGTTHLNFQLVPKSEWQEPGLEIPVTVQVNAPELNEVYERTFNLSTILSSEAHQRTFVSPVDGSTQYYGVRTPTSVRDGTEYGLVVSLHGASVEAIGQARAYSSRNWTYLIAPTNRRPFGFDWEEWGRLNALASMDHAMASYSIDPSKVHLTGHSMGGHGTWHVGITTPGRFATLGPSAGWESFYSYGGSERPTGPVARARAHSDTLNYLSNIARRGVYVIHGDADDNVPIREGRNMFQAAQMYTNDIVMHEQPGAGHWWDGDVAPGADCVDWPELFQFMKRRQLDPWETDFHFRSASPSYNGVHSFVHLESALSPDEDIEIRAMRDAEAVVLELTNVRSMTLDGDALRLMGVERVIVGDEHLDVVDGPMSFGPMDGKNADVHGPFNQVFRSPFCFIYSADGTEDARTAAYLSSYWALIGNGQACGLSESQLQDVPGLGHNRVYLGSAALPLKRAPFDWDADGAIFNGVSQSGAALMYVTPDEDRLAAVLVAPEGREHLLRRLNPFSSRSGLPDYLVFGDQGGIAIGHFGSDWQYDPAFGRP